MNIYTCDIGQPTAAIAVIVVNIAKPPPLSHRLFRDHGEKNTISDCAREKYHN